MGGGGAYLSWLLFFLGPHFLEVLPLNHASLTLTQNWLDFENNNNNKHVHKIFTNAISSTENWLETLGVGPHLGMQSFTPSLVASCLVCDDAQWLPTGVWGQTAWA